MLLLYLLCLALGAPDRSLQRFILHVLLMLLLLLCLVERRVDHFSGLNTILAVDVQDLVGILL